MNTRPAYDRARYELAIQARKCVRCHCRLRSFETTKTCRACIDKINRRRTAPWKNRCGECGSTGHNARRCLKSLADQAVVAMSWIMALAWCEAMAQEEWADWSDMPGVDWSDMPGVTEHEREMIVGRAIRMGLLKVAL